MLLLEPGIREAERPSRQLSGGIGQLVLLILNGGRWSPIGMHGTAEPWLPCGPEEPLKSSPEEPGALSQPGWCGQRAPAARALLGREGAEMTLGSQNLLEA